MALKLILKNRENEVVRIFDHCPESFFVLRMRRTRRLEVVEFLEPYQRRKIAFEVLFTSTLSEVAANPLLVGENLKLHFESMQNDQESQGLQRNIPVPIKKDIYSRIGASSILLTLAIVTALGILKTEETPKSSANVTTAIAKIVTVEKRKPIITSASEFSTANVSDKPTQKTSAPKSVSRLGALKVLGSLSKSSQKSGLDLGSIQTTRGPGLGGSGIGKQGGGTGGVQSSLYGKGIVSAPVGLGGNLRGNGGDGSGGGYGTKSQAGGQAGYGSMSLVGSTGSAPIPLGREALIEGGLDRDLIAAVVQKNMGQVRFCYEQGLQSDPKLGGRVAIDFVINADGQVQIASIANSSLNSKSVEDCIVMRLRTWKFPLPEGGLNVKVS